MKRPNFQPIFEKKSDFCEVSNDQPIRTFIPNQAIDLKELIARFDRGQRLNVHENFAPLSNFTRDSIYEEDFEDAPPDNVHDVVDVQEYYRDHENHKRDFQKRQKEKKAKNPAPQRGTQQGKEDLPTPPPESHDA